MIRIIHTVFLTRRFVAAALLGAVLVPVVAHAASTATIKDILDTATQVMTLAVPTAAILLFFMWSMWQVISNSGDAEKLKKARSKILWGVIILTVLFSLGAIIAVLQATFFKT